MMSVPRVTDVLDGLHTYLPAVRYSTRALGVHGQADRTPFSRAVSPPVFPLDAERHKPKIRCMGWPFLPMLPAVLLSIILSLLHGSPQARSTVHVAKITCIRFNRLGRLGLG